MLSVKLWECQTTPSGELMLGESCNGDFTGDSDLILLAHSNAKETDRNI
jgi:hypothetical protein